MTLSLRIFSLSVLMLGWHLSGLQQARAQTAVPPAAAPTSTPATTAPTAAATTAASAGSNAGSGTATAPAASGEPRPVEMQPLPPPASAPMGPPIEMKPPLLTLDPEPNPIIPAAPEIGGAPLARLLDLEPNWTGLGSFKLRLPKFGINAYTHGITELLFAAQSQNDPAEVLTNGMVTSPGLHSYLPGTPASFIGNFDLFVGAELRNLIFTELEVIFTSDGGRVDVNFAQIDVRLYRDFLFLRGGKFQVPIGGMNVYPDAYFTFKLPELPLFYTNIVPSRWSEVGLELYGRYSWGEGRGLSYAFYVVNGLEQKDGGSGGNIGLMEDNLRDAYDADKAVGGQVQLEPLPGFTFGLSGYTGVYTQTGHLRLSMGDFHIGLQHKKLTLRGEVVAAFQDVTNDTLTKVGTYGLASYRIIPYIEPVVMFDWLKLDGDPTSDRTTGTIGTLIYPYPQKVPSGALRLAYSFSWDGNWDFAGHRFAAMLVVGY